MQFPSIDPVAIHLGPLAVRWYALAYITGILLGWFYLRAMNRRMPLPNLTPKALEEVLSYAVLGIVLGGRLGYVLFYKPGYYLEHPLHIPALWEGGMSFHGGLLGVLAAFILFCRRYRVSFLPFMDMMACATPIGLFFGRLANFVNGELFGRVSNVPWAMVFPHGGPLPRHPSQLYEAGLEGLALGVTLFLLQRFTRARTRPGLLAGGFLAGYACARLFAEQFREPDAHLGFLFGFITMGQLLCLPMLVLGAILLARACCSGAHGCSAMEAGDLRGA